MKLKLIGLAALFAAGSAFAAPTVYSTTGSFSDPTTATLFSYSGSPVGTTVTEPYPSNANFGYFTATGVAGTAGGTFTLNLTQAAPLPNGNSSLTSDVLTGSVSASSSGVNLVFSGPTHVVNGANVVEFTIGNVTYGIDELTRLNPSTSGFPAGTTALEGVIIGTPEPTFYALTASGFLGLLGMAIRRKKQNA